MLLIPVVAVLAISGADVMATILVKLVFVLLLGGGIGYFILALLIRCPHCDYKFLKNPKGFGPVNFHYHENCPKIRFFNPWAYQVGRCFATGQIRCINCGEEIFCRGPANGSAQQVAPADAKKRRG